MFLSLIGGYTGSSKSIHAKNATLLEITFCGSLMFLPIPSDSLLAQWRVFPSCNISPPSSYKILLVEDLAISQNTVNSM